MWLGIHMHGICSSWILASKMWKMIWQYLAAWLLSGIFIERKQKQVFNVDIFGKTAERQFFSSAFTLLLKCYKRENNWNSFGSGNVQSKKLKPICTNIPCVPWSSFLHKGNSALLLNFTGNCWCCEVQNQKENHLWWKRPHLQFQNQPPWETQYSRWQFKQHALAVAFLDQRGAAITRRRRELVVEKPMEADCADQCCTPAWAPRSQELVMKAAAQPGLLSKWASWNKPAPCDIPHPTGPLFFTSLALLLEGPKC